MLGNLKQLPRYLINLGLVNGFYVFCQVELLNLAKVKMPGYAYPMFLRPGTSDKKVFREVFLFRLYNFAVPIEVKTIVDGGANIGLSAVYFANRFKNSVVYAIEPEGSNIQMLERNSAPYPNIKIIRSALWYRDTFLKIKNLGEAKWAFSVQECKEGELDSFRGISIPTWMRENSIDNLDLLKLDIEGSEKELFQFDTDRWLPKTKVIVVELHDWMKAGCSASFFTALGKYPISVTIHEGMLVVHNNTRN